MPIHHDTYAMQMKECTKRKAIHMLQMSSTTNSGNQPHTKLTNGRLLEGMQKGLDTTGKRAQEQKTHKLPRKHMH
jgi:hypothetical protein